MDLTIKDVAEKLLVSEKTVYRWVKEAKIPVYRIHGQYRFKSQEIDDWILRNKKHSPSSRGEFSRFEDRAVKMVDLLERGGIFYRIEGENAPEAIENAVRMLRPGRHFPRDVYLANLLDREKLIPTSLGRGVALPHSRDVHAPEVEEEFVALFFLEKPVEYGALDGEPVFCFFLFLAANLRRHHDIMMRIVFFCQRPGFKALLRRQASRGELLAYIAEKEREWESLS